MWRIPHQNRVLLFVVVFASALLYLAVLLLLRVADREEISVIRNAVRIRR